MLHRCCKAMWSRLYEKLPSKPVTMISRPRSSPVVEYACTLRRTSPWWPGPGTAPLLGLSTSGPTTVVKCESTEQGGDWVYDTLPPPTVVPIVSPGQYTSPDALLAGVSTAANAYLVSSANQFCFRTVRSQPHLARIPPGQYTPEQLAEAVTVAMNAACTVQQFSVSFAFGAFTISNSATDFTLEFQVNPTSSSAASKPLTPDHMIRRMMGFEGKQYTGGRCYVGKRLAIPFADVQRYMRYRYSAVEATGDDAVYTGVHLCAERWYSGEACEKCLAGAATATDDVVKLDYTSGANTLTLKHTAAVMGLQPCDVVAIGIPGCDCPITSLVDSVSIDPATGHQTVTVHVPVPTALPFGTLTDQCVRVWLHDLPRFDLLLRSEHLSTMLGFEHTFHGGQGCYASHAAVNLTPHPFLLVQIGTPSHTAPYKYYAGTGKVVPVFTTLGMAGGWKQFQETYDAKLSGIANVGSLKVEFFNPDLTPYQFHGREHYLQLLVVCEGQRAMLSCT